MLRLNAILVVSAVLLAVCGAVPARHRGLGTSSTSAALLRDAAAVAMKSNWLALDKDVNIVHLTDVHSWLSGHLHEPDNEADYPDVLAFFQHLEAAAHAKVNPAFSRKTQALLLPSLDSPQRHCERAVPEFASHPLRRAKTFSSSTAETSLMALGWRAPHPSMASYCPTSSDR